jgi:hypothetical protein
MAESDTSAFTRRAPFTPYDILGYLIPGGILIAALAGFEAFIVSSSKKGGLALHTPIYTSISRLFLATPTHADWALQAVTILLIGTVSYVVGHIVASISALFIDRWYVEKAHGYPFLYLLRLDIEGADNYSRRFHRGLFFWLSSYLFLRYVTLPNGLAVSELVPSLLRSYVPSLLSVMYLKWAATVVGWMLFIMTAVKMILSAREANGDRTLKTILNLPSAKPFLSRLEFSILVFSFPGNLITRFLGSYLHTRDRLDLASVRMFKKRMLSTLGVKQKDDNALAFLRSSSTFWYAYLHLRAAPAEISEPAENWLRLYSFARNLSTAFYLAFLYCLFWWRFQGEKVQVTPDAHYTILVLPLVVWAAAFVMLLRYYYIYAGYFTKYTLRAFVYLTRPRPA